MFKHYRNLVPYGWNVASIQASTKGLDQVRDKINPSLLQKGREYPIHSWSFVLAKESTAHSTLL